MPSKKEPLKQEELKDELKETSAEENGIEKGIPTEGDDGQSDEGEITSEEDGEPWLLADAIENCITVLGEYKKVNPEADEHVNRIENLLKHAIEHVHEINASVYTGVTVKL